MSKKKFFLWKPTFYVSLLCGAVLAGHEFWQIASRTGNWLGGFSLKWAAGMAIFLMFLTLLFCTLWLSFWRFDPSHPLFALLIGFRQKMGRGRWIFLPFLLVLPAYFFQYTRWGLVFTGAYFRVFVWAVFVILLAFILSEDESTLIQWHSFLLGVLLSSASFTLASEFSVATDYPFNLYWSDGNRIWDYSLFFGKHLYHYPADVYIESLTSRGRQFLWGLPFLLPGVTIFTVRFWSALLATVPYVVLGWLLAGKSDQCCGRFLFGLWTLLFLSQGPIYTPLVICAILVGIAWRRPLWLAVPVMVGAGYYAQMSRWTWLFAPAIWIGMMELGGKVLSEENVTWVEIKRTAALVFSGLFGGYLIPVLLTAFRAESASIVSVSGVAASISRQPLLWYRLLPNDTYPAGVLFGLLIAVLPLSMLLIFLYRRKYIYIPAWATWAGFLVLGSFLAVGLIISTKIGGGTNLHNLDMFLVSLVLIVGLIWQNGGIRWLLQEGRPVWVQGLLVMCMVLPTIKPLINMRPRLSLSPEATKQVKTLLDIGPYDNVDVSTLPAPQDVSRALEDIRAAVAHAAVTGDILFIDQRQLLTFGEVPAVPLVPDYEKKVLMEQALRGNETYFHSYYQALADHRFSLIVSEPLKVNYKGEQAGSFAEESDAWTRWVAAPTLCFYEPLTTFKSVYIQLLIPREEPLDCSAFLAE